jgi:uncharacterized protein (DUF488 family)
MDELCGALMAAKVELVVDVRHIPRSRTNPQFNQDTFPASLRERHIGYIHLRALGGLRGRPRGSNPSPNMYWRNESFRNYADHAMTAEFAAALRELRTLGQERTATIMCAEALWWRCHRRIIADYLLAAGEQVFHIMTGSRIEPASLNPGAVRREDGTLIYPAEK